MARPTKLTKELTKQLAGYIAGGNYHETACAIVGVSTTSFYKWKSLGERALAGEKDDDGKTIPKRFVEFVEAIKKAEALAEAKRIQLIDKQANDDWRAAAWYLERRYPQRWGRNDRVNVQASGPDGGPIPMETKLVPDLKNLSLDELEVLHGIVAKLETPAEPDTD